MLLNPPKLESGARMKFWSQTNKSKPKVCMSMALAGVRKETRGLIGWGRDVLIGPSDYVFLKSDKLFLSSSHFCAGQNLEVEPFDRENFPEVEAFDHENLSRKYVIKKRFILGSGECKNTVLRIT
jgi:hypothetical protein